MDGLRSRIPGLKIEWCDGWAPSDDECDDYGGGGYGGAYYEGGGCYGYGSDDLCYDSY